MTSFGPPPCFDALPTEIKLHIFLHTNVKDLQSCRSVNHELKDIIDDDKSQDKIARFRLAAAVERLRKRATEIRAIAELPLLEALRLFLQHRGIQKDGDDRCSDAEAFATYRNGEAASDPSHGGGLSSTSYTAQQLFDLHVRSHMPKLTLIDPEASFLVDMKKFTYQGVEEGYSRDMNESDVVALYHQISREPAYLPMHIQQRRRGEDGGFPRYPLTRLQVNSKTGTRAARLEGFCTVLEIVDLLDVPDIGDKKFFAYYTEEAWVYNRIQQAVYGKKLTIMQKAALLEAISIY